MARCTARRSSGPRMPGKKPPSRCVATSGTTTTRSANSRATAAATVDLPPPGPPEIATRRADIASARAEQAITHVAQAGIHVAVFGEALVDGRRVDAHVGELRGQRLHALARRDEADVAHGAGAGFEHA